MLMMHATQQHNGYSSHTQPQRPDSTALCMTDIGRSHPVENGKLNRNASGMQDHTSDRRSTSLPARKPSPQSPVDGLPNMTAFSVHGSASLPTAAAFLGETADILPDSAAASYSPRTKTCLYKTEVCCSWKKSGKCRYGSKCQFAHGMEELRPVNRHPKYKTEICRSYAQTGECRYGRRCRFIHPDSKSSVVPQTIISPHNSMELPYSIPAPVSQVADPTDSFAHTPVTDLPRNLSAYLSLLSQDQGRGLRSNPYPQHPPQLHPQDQTGMLLNAVSQQQHDAAVAMLQTSHAVDPLGNSFAPQYSAAASPLMQIPQPSMAYTPDMNNPYANAQSLSAFNPANSLRAPDLDLQLPLMSQDSHMSHMDQLTVPAQYPPELLQMLAANQITQSGHAEFNATPHQVDLSSHPQHPFQIHVDHMSVGHMPVDHMSHMPLESQHMPSLSSSTTPHDVMTHLMSLGCGRSSAINNQMAGLGWDRAGYNSWANSF